MLQHVESIVQNPGHVVENVQQANKPANTRTVGDEEEASTSEGALASQ